MNRLSMFSRITGLEITDKFRTLTALTMIPVVILCCGFACNVQNVVSRVDSILNEIGPAIQIITSLLPLLNSKNIPADVIAGVNTWVPRVEADLQQIETEWAAIQSDLQNPSNQAKINALVSTAQNDILSVLPIFRVLDASTQGKIVAIVNAAAAGVLAAENITAAAEGKVSARAGVATAFASDGKDFKKKFNAVLKAPTGDAVVDVATAKLAL